MASNQQVGLLHRISPLGSAFALAADDTDQKADYRHRLSIWQMEVNRTQLFTRPVRGRDFFEQVIRENLDLGRQDKVQLVFGWRVYRKTPSRFITRVTQAGVQPNLHLTYKHSLVKQYFKENRALRT